MDFKDYYQVLGVEPSATADDIKRVYKKLARKYHPDVSDDPDAQSKFQEVSEAYEVLRNKEKRAEYDELREYVNNPNKFRGGGQGQFYKFDSGFSAEDQFEDLLRSIFGDSGFDGQGFSPNGFGNANGAGFGDSFSGGFGDERFTRGFGGAGPTGRAPRQAARHTLKIRLEEAWGGGSRQLRLSGASGDKTINVKIPKGIESGKELRLRGQSGDGGDLYLKIEIEPHQVYGVEGRDILLTLPVSPWEAALGASITVPTLGGRVNLKVPPNSQSGKKLRMKGRGLNDGDQIVTLSIVNPEVNDDEARAAYAALADQFEFDPRRALATH